MGLQDTFKALGDKNRREMLRLLRGGAMTAGDIGAHFAMSAATLSHHLSVLRQAELVMDQKKGKYIYYELNASVFEELMLWISEFKEEHHEVQ